MPFLPFSAVSPLKPLELSESGWVQKARAGLFGGVFALLSLLFWWWPTWHLLEEQVRDGLTSRFVVSSTPHPDVVLIDFSDSSIQTLGGWPLNRSRMADLVEELLGPLGAKVVGLDMMFPEPGDPVGDARLASLAEHGPLVLSHVLDMQQRSTPIRVGTPAVAVAPPQWLGHDWAALPSFGYVANHAGLAKARCVGHVGVTLDGDGVMRRLAPLVQGPHGVLNTLSVAMLDCGVPQARASTIRPALPHSGRWLASAESASSWRLPFAYGMASFVTLEAADVLAGAVDANLTRGKYVLVGSSAVGLSDYVTTPLQSLTPGVLVHAQALAVMLDSGKPVPASLPFVGAFWAAFLVAGAVWLVWQRHKTRAWVLAVVCAVGWPAVCVWAFGLGWFVWVLFVPAVVLACLLALSALEFKLLRDAKQRALHTLSQFVAAPVLKQLLALGLSRSLQPKLQDITVLVVDMRDYTRLTTEMTLEEIAELTRDFLALITLPVLEHEGTLDRYSGDGLIAFWGAPLAQQAHADMALACAASLRQALAQWNEQRAAQGKEPIGMRIGVESGPALVGDLGNAVRSVYTAVGSCINTASRLQELGRDLGCDWVIGPQTKARTSLPLTFLALLPIKGLPAPLQVYTRELS
jgi:adenylate cyclase